MPPVEPRGAPSPREQLFAGVALGIILLVTAGWWALALWPLPAEGAAWIARTRAICFGATESGLPDAEGWALLIGQPASMIAVLLIGWGRATRTGLARTAGSLPGRVGLGLATAGLLVGAGAAGVRVSEAAAADAPPALPTPATPAAEYPRLDDPAPGPLALVDQSGEDFDLARYLGRPVLVTFAFAHCETVCPVLVREVIDAQRLAGDAGTRPAVVVITVDPWRDTPARLQHVAHQWELAPDAHVLSGSIQDVQGTLERWNVSTSRDPRTGDITHPALVYVLDGDGRLAFATTGGGAHAAALVARLD